MEKQTKVLIRDSDKGEGVKKIRECCGRHKWKPPEEEREFCGAVARVHPESLASPLREREREKGKNEGDSAVPAADKGWQTQ